MPGEDDRMFESDISSSRYTAICFVEFVSPLEEILEIVRLATDWNCTVLREGAILLTICGGLFGSSSSTLDMSSFRDKSFNDRESLSARERDESLKVWSPRIADFSADDKIRDVVIGVIVERFNTRDIFGSVVVKRETETTGLSGRQEKSFFVR